MQLNVYAHKWATDGLKIKCECNRRDVFQIQHTNGELVCDLPFGCGLLLQPETSHKVRGHFIFAVFGTNKFAWKSEK
jgi:hypothetical protein